ncbi:hypothetical protein PL81_38235 [Streptomyces sp. RSD-27]|nr:hypothetical protein PL81_38235 [Streptomyces sp. RSD-27]
MTVTDGTGADRTSRRTAAAPFTALDPDGSLPHGAFGRAGADGGRGTADGGRRSTGAAVPAGS